MPLYEYECQKCHTRTERIEKLSGPHLKVCPKCKGRVERLISPPAIQFKGSGWYVTDYARKGASSSESGADGAKDSASSKSEKTETKKTDKKADKAAKK